MPEQIGKFEVKEKIGEGGMGVVYKAYDPLMHRYVAIKTFTAELDAGPEVRLRFLREAIAVGRLTHGNIVTVHDVFEDAGRTYLVMEYLEGESLERAMRSGSLQGLEDRLWVMEEVLKGLIFAHSMGVIHRDIKPANVFITARGDVKILDFGIARIASTTVSKSTTKVMGTPYYMSPEQWLGKNVDHRTDIFAIGVMLYELLTGRRPFESFNAQAVAFQVINTDPPPVQELNASISDDLADVVARSMAKNPDDRFSHAEELREALLAISANLDEPNRRLSSPGQTPAPGGGARTPRVPGKQSSPSQRPTKVHLSGPPTRTQTTAVDPGKRWLWAALALTTALAVTAVGLLLTRREAQEPAPAPATPVSERVEEKTPETAASPAVAPPPATTPANVPTTSVAPRTATGTLVLRGTQGASVSVDGRPQGTVPTTLELAPGTHRVLLSKGRARWEDVVTIRPGGRVTLDRRLDRAGTLAVNSEIWATVELDGSTSFETPHLFQGVPAGSHTLRVSREGYEEQVHEIVIGDSENKQLALRMQKGR